MELTVIQGVADSLGIPFDGLPKDLLVRRINERLAATRKNETHTIF
jgi:hypothetical protein